ncbi:lipoamide acyltransferase component of branched-chain alpha-keto acid dehydrogenase complex, mitochondrial-like isoform X2 [Phragmites australis]|uniref:lipoamide acyltransferase component of branched-chain alpha-keto acid dehydrogenase complex, mitochondrial-like isoform X2 n=1 Tax=Phragmites australis TaxID=29695 RepID=UPI002D76D0D1|nr:lipoamide acyltransferase component of branched-chain alpha-keto acid dehydrogenase complex, mitochondrial-like isoform X2 [Phragmites australis]
MAWTRLASRSRLRRPAAVAPRASLPSPSPSPPPAPRAGPLAPSSSPSPRRHLLLPRFRFTAAAFSPSPSPSPVRLLGDRCWAGDARRWFASETSAVPASAGEAAELVEVPLAQTGEGIAECELLRWYVTEVGETLLKMIVGDSQSVSHDNIAPPIDKSLGVDSTNPSGEDNIPSGALSTPAVRHLAKQYGLNINDIQGTGKDGRVLKEDVLNHAVSKGLRKELSSVLEENIGQVELLEEGKSLLDVHCYEDKKIPLRGYQRSMVKSMSLAAKVPHFHYLEEINCDALVELKAAFQNENKDHNIKHTFLPFLIKSLSMALSKYPLLNSSFIEETNEVVLKGSHNIGVAMATEHGLVVPNIKTVQSLSILEITKELARLHETALHNRLSSTDISGGTITLSNIGAIGGKFGSPLLNLPEVAIIALGRIQKLPRFDDDENVYASSIMNVTVGADHRVVDGAMVARFCNEWKILVEKPKLLLLHMR